MHLFTQGAVCFFAAAVITAKADVRHISTQKDQISTVRTALGIATIIQVPDRPTSVVIGDQNAFKVEYLDQAVTIKPLTANARTNLYIYTDWQRYNIKLVSTNKEAADYVVYLKPKTTAPKNSKIRWKKFKNHLKNDSLRLDVEEVGTGPNDLLLVKFEIQSTENETFKPEWIWMSQNGDSVPIHQLFLSDLNVNPQKKISGIIQLKKNDLALNSPLKFEVRRKKFSYLTIKEPNRW